MSRNLKSPVLLVVDDDDHLRSLVHRLAVGVGYRVVEARSGRHALDLLEAFPIRPDVVLLDLDMPEMGGAEFIDEAERRALLRREIVVVFTTDTELAPTTGATLRKGCPAVELVEVLDRLAHLQREAPLASTVELVG